MKVPMFLALVILACSIAITIDQFAYAEPGEPSKNPYPYVDPIREYYDNLQLNAKPYPPAPVYYDPFSLSIEKNPNCGWISINGRVPDTGMVTVEVKHKVLADNNPDREYWKTLTTQNINSNPTYELRGYVNIPCYLPSNTYQVNLSWSEFPYKIDGLQTTHYMKISTTYEIVIDNWWN